MDNDPLLIVSGLTVAFDDGAGSRISVIEDVSFSVLPSTTLVLFGESRSGKTVLSRSLTGLLNGNGHATGTVLFNGVELLSAGEDVLREIRRVGIRHVFQNAARALNPFAKVEAQLRVAGGNNNREDLSALLDTVGITNGREVLRSYPHQLSAGMAQRVMLTMAVLVSPKLLIVDEPMSVVDASLQLRLRNLIDEWKRSRGLTVLLITRDLDIARLLGEHVAVLYEGRLVESAPTTEFFEHPFHPYSRMLIGLRRAGPAKIVDPGESTGEEERAENPMHCRFSLRCPVARPRCSEDEPLMEHAGPDREVRCFYWK